MTTSRRRSAINRADASLPASQVNAFLDENVAQVHRIILARPRDVAMLPAIELAAARLLVGHAPESILNETTSLDVLHAAQRHGRLWVALADDVPVGFAHVERLEPAVAHLEEIDVRPDYGRRGLGKRLVTTVCAWAAAAGYEKITTSTGREGPFHS